MNTSKTATNLRSARSRKLGMNRRSTFMLAIGGAVGLATQSGRARAEPGATESGGAMLATTNETGGLRSPKPQFQNLTAVGPDRQVVTIRHDGDTFEVTTADGRSTVFPAVNIRFKIDSSDSGPPVGRPVILPGGMMGDRATVFFASAAEIGERIRYRG
jgi:cytochrome c